MSAIEISIVVFACVFGGALFGMYLRAHLPEHHLSEESATMVKLCTGLMGTMAALLLSLQLGTAKASFDTLNNELTQVSANLVLLDRVLAYYGPEAQPARRSLKASAERTMDLISGSDPRARESGQPTLGEQTRTVYDSIQALSPATDAQRAAKNHALDVTFTIGQARWLMLAQQANHVSIPLIAVLVSWLTMIFISFGLFAPRNATVIAALAACAGSIAGAIFLLIEFYTPLSGVIRISEAPLHRALALLGT